MRKIPYSKGKEVCFKVFAYGVMSIISESVPVLRRLDDKPVYSK